jgi:4-hydroxy-tetrahydrodipicolinate reductase
MRVVVFGRDGKVGSVIVAKLREAGHDVTGVEVGEEVELAGHDAAVDFTAPTAVLVNVTRALEAGVACVVGTTGLTEDGLAELDRLAQERNLPCFVAPNFAIGAVLMMRFAEEASRHMPHAEVIELHHETKLDAPSGTAKATAARMGGEVSIHSVRLPGLIAHQEVIFGAAGQYLTIRHDTTSREAFVPGVLLALEKLHDLPPGLTIGLDALLGDGS